MATVAPPTSAAAAAPASNAAGSRASIAQNFDSFLLLLTTQLKNQSPLDPLDTNQFTQQLVQFASVEQQIRTNETLTALLTSSQASTLSTVSTFVGMEVTADGQTTRLSGGRAEWTVDAGRAASQASFIVKDKTGNVVATETRALAAGPQSFVWNGRTSTGTIAPEGDYTIDVRARDAAGQSVTIRTELVGTVDSVDLAGDIPILLVGSARIPLTSVRSIGRPDTP